MSLNSILYQFEHILSIGQIKIMKFKKEIYLIKIIIFVEKAQL